MKKGEIYYADLRGSIGSEQSGERPVMVIQNDIGNRYSPTTIVAAITTTEKKTHMPTHVQLDQGCGLNEKSVVMLEQIRTVDKGRLKIKIGQCDDKTLQKVNQAIHISFFKTDK